METRFQHLLLRFNAVFILSVFSLNTFANDQTAAIDSEYFEIGASTGVINIEDFGSEFTFGANATFKATENFFLQFNIFQTKAGFSSYERNQEPFFTGSDRNFQHYDLLLGYNIFQGEVFRNSWSGLSSLYIVSGVGDTEFGGETGFSYTLGFGYQMALSRHYTLRFDYRDYIYKSSLTDELTRTTHNTHLAVGLTYLF